MSGRVSDPSSLLQTTMSTDMESKSRTYYKPINSVVVDGTGNYTREFRDYLYLPGLATWLSLQIGVPLTILRTINQSISYKGTRLAVHNLQSCITAARTFQRESVLISPIPIISFETRFQYKRLQFLVRLSVAITIGL